MKTCLTTLIAILATFSLFAQNDQPLEVQFGKLDKGELELLPVGQDSAAEAYVLVDKESISVKSDYDGGLVIDQRKHRRVKLLRASSFDRGDVELFFNPKYERITNVDAVIHLPDGEKIKLKNKDLIKEDITDTRKVIKFTFPGVTEGAVLEYRYQNEIENVTVPPRFFFQEDIPVRYVEYKSTIPIMFSYVNLGNAGAFDVKEITTDVGLFGGQSVKVNENLYAYKDLPAYIDQPYVNNFEDFIPQVRYQLQSITYTNGHTEKVFETWAHTCEEMDGWDSFGKAYKAKGMSNSIWKDAKMKIAGLTTDTEKAQALYTFVGKKIRWNGKYDWTCDRSPDKVYAAKTGDSGELSITLLALLHQAGIKAHPVLVPLRGGGAPITIYPIISQFQHVMVLAVLDGKEIILDPNGLARPMGLPRSSALNRQVMVMEAGNPHWMDLQVPRATQTVMAKMALDENGMAEVNVTSRLRSYYAYSGRLQIKEMETDQEFPIVRKIMTSFPAAELVDKKIKEQERPTGDLDLEMNLKVPVGETIEDYMYVQPVLFPTLEEELADTRQRLYPVDFAFPWAEQYVSTIEPPAGFVLEELPESIRYRSEDRAISVAFSASEGLNKEITVSFKVAIDRTLFAANEYEGLRNIFDKIIELQSSSIVFKRAK